MIKSILTVKIETWIGVVIVGFFAILLGALALSKISEFYNYIDGTNAEYYKEGVLTLSIKNTRQIDKWLKENNLNKYGDSIGAVYIGGSPLFDENTGEEISRFEYIFRKYPDRPWRDE